MTPAAPVRRVVAIVNPTAGRRKLHRVEAVSSHLTDAGVLVTWRPTTAAGDAEMFAREIAEAGDADLLLVAGGDGTINEVINGLDGTVLPIAVVPNGTANVLALDMGLPFEPHAIADAIVAGHTRDLCVGQVNSRKFVLMAGVGFDADVVARVSLKIKRLFGKGAYGWATLCSLVHYRHPAIRLRLDGEEVEVASAVVANGRLYAGPHVCAPDGDVSVPGFQVCLFLKPGVLAVMTYAVALFTGRLSRLKSVRVVPARVVEMISPPGARVQVDGDNAAATPLTLRADGPRIPLIVGQA